MPAAPGPADDLEPQVPPPAPRVAGAARPNDPPGEAPARVAYLAFDACDADIVADLAARGELPTFARVLADGASVTTVAPAGVYPSAIWPSILTGLSPARHRYYSWSEVGAQSYDTRDTSPGEIRGTPFVATLAERGRRVAALDLPHTHAIEGFNGAMLSEWGCHDRHGETASWPPDLLAQLNEAVGPHPVGCHEGPGFVQFDPSDYLHRTGSRRTPDEVEALFADLCEGHERKRALTLSVLEQGDWDLFAAVFSEGHCTGHQLWHVHDEGHPWHEPADRARVGSPIVEMYRRFDATLARHLERLGPDIPVFVHLSHGMGPHYDGTDLLEHVLRLLDDPGAAGPFGRRGIDVLDKVPAAFRSVPARSLGKVSPLDAAWRRWLRRQPRQTFDELPPESGVAADRAGRRCFAIPNNTVTGAVRINVAGRDPQGTVARGAEYDALCDELAGALAELVNIDTGEPLVLGVTRGDALHPWSEDDPFPDLLVTWNRSATIERIWSPRFGAIEVPRRHWRTGDHTDRGLLVALGPGIVAGPRGGPVSVVDVAPTICAALGEVLPDVDGHPVVGLVAHPAALPADLEWTVPDPPSSAGDRVSIVERLRDDLRESARRRARDWLGLPEVDRQISDVAGSLAVLSDEHLATRRAANWATDLAEDTRDHALAAQRYAEFVNASVEAVADHIGRLTLQVDELAAGVERIGIDRVGDLYRLTQIDTTMRWIEMIDQPEDLLVSVIMPTYNRAGVIGAAIDSVLAQEYGKWELLVVDDGSTDATSEVLDRYDDPRIRRFRGEHGGCSAARNLALAQITGGAVVYLDDDNLMHPRWLKSVAWALGQRPDVDVLFGARVIDDYDRVRDFRTAGGMPWIQFEPYDRDRLEQHNFTDVGVIAHRAGLPEAHFDERIVSYGDWDLFLRLTRDRPPLELPAIAIAYATDRPDRLSATTELDADHALVRAKVRSGGADLAEKRVGDPPTSPVG